MPHNAWSPHNNTCITCSTSQLSGPIPHPIIPTYDQTMALMKEELWYELQCMYGQNGALVQTTQILTAQLDATNAHCTMAQWALAQSRLELENVKKKKQPRKSVKLCTCFVTHPELEEDFNKAEEEQCKKDKADAEKLAKKKTEDEVCHTQIEHNIESKTFDALSTLQCKDDFIAVAGTLKISRDRMVEKLRTRIKEFLADPTNQHFADNPHFAALFQMGKTHLKNKTLAAASSTGQASSGISQDNDATSSNTSSTHFFTPPASAHSFNSNYPPYFTNQPYIHQFYANPALCAPSYSTMQHNNLSGSPIASSSNLDRQPQHPYNTHSLPIYPTQFYNYSTNHGHPCT
ncbi:hypothetical protein BDR04DRAFT_1232989 [Suillus decipiens]|nr:hypothetical protein BDR04DRAFT_1232989 [Suillus decipiens]